MNHIIERTEPGSVRTRSLVDWLIAHGVGAFSTAQASYLLGVPANHVRQRLAPLRARGEVVAAGRGLWVPVPPDRRAWGAPEPMAYIDELMGLMGVKYVVGWLSAAALHGASHQAVQVFQVATDVHAASRNVGRGRLEFAQRSYIVEFRTERITVASGRANVATVAATMLMLAADLKAAGGIDNAATAILEMAEENSGWEHELDEFYGFFPVSAVRRCGWLLEEFAGVRLDELASACARTGTAASVLAPQLARGGAVNRRWGIDLNRTVEPDL